MHKGLLFAMNEQLIEPTERVPWRMGRSGIQAWYMYNFTTSNFGHCEIHAIREEI